jgi:hypothetical protein
VAVRSKAWVCGRSLEGISGSNVSEGMDVSVVSVVCGRVEVSATSRSVVQRILPSVVRLSVIVKLRQCGGPEPNRDCPPVENMTRITQLVL